MRYLTEPEALESIERQDDTTAGDSIATFFQGLNKKILPPVLVKSAVDEVKCNTRRGLDFRRQLKERVSCLLSFILLFSTVLQYNQNE
jgi:hypothetical protein